jgi:hypothetical protein
MLRSKAERQKESLPNVLNLNLKIKMVNNGSKNEKNENRI